jgi:type VI secretion system protein ImpH
MKSLRSILFSEPYRFEFFQAVRLLQHCFPDKTPVGYPWSTTAEPVRFRALPSLSFPTSELFELLPPDSGNIQAQMTVTFFGLYGPSGALPTHYTQLLLDLERDVRGEERWALRAWLDLFNHRLTSLFYRAWEKYRVELPYERGAAFRKEPDSFTQALFSLIGVGHPTQRNRLAIYHIRDQQRDEEPEQAACLAKIDDFALLYYGGLLAHHPRNQISLQRILQDYFGLQVSVLQFHGQWLAISREGQTQLGTTGTLGADAVAGSHIWERQGKFRVRLGPLAWQSFQEYLPDLSPTPNQKTIFLAMHLIRFYAGPQFDFDVQLVLDRRTVPASQLDGSSPVGLRLGWNTWIINTLPPHDLDDAVFEDQMVTRILEQ